MQAKIKATDQASGCAEMRNTGFKVRRATSQEAKPARRGETSIKMALTAKD
jgi:hypothetical protein